MKMIEGKPVCRKQTGLPLDSLLYAEYYAYLEAERFPILFHVNDPEEYWDPVQIPGFVQGGACDYTDGTFSTKEALYQEVEHILVRYPDLRIIFAHFYYLSGDIDRAADFLDRHPLVSLDITPGSEMYYNFSRKHDEWHDFFTCYQDRIVFGSDNFANADPDFPAKACRLDHHIQQFLAATAPYDIFGWSYIMNGLALKLAVLRKICRDNLYRYTGEKPAPVNHQAAVALCDQAIEYATAAGNDAEVINYLEEIKQRLKGQ